MARRIRNASPAQQAQAQVQRAQPRRKKSYDEQIEENRASQRRDMQRVREMDHLTEQAKRAEMERLQEHYAARHQELLEEQRTAREQRRERLERKIFSPTSQNRASYRQALEQAGQAETPQQLRSLYDQAIVTNDSDLMQAAVYHAAQRNYQGILGDYSDRNPQAAQALSEYSSPEVSPSDRDLFRQRLFQATPPKPGEIRRNSYDV